MIEIKVYTSDSRTVGMWIDTTTEHTIHVSVDSGEPVDHIISPSDSNLIPVDIPSGESTIYIDTEHKLYFEGFDYTTYDSGPKILGFKSGNLIERVSNLTHYSSSPSEFGEGDVDLSGVTCIGAFAFYESTFSSPLIIPDSVNSINEGSFCGCYFYEKLTIPSSITNWCYAFYYWDTDPNHATFYKGIEIYASEIPGQAFLYCQIDGPIIIHSTYIDDEAFSSIDTTDYFVEIHFSSSTPPALNYYWICELASDTKVAIVVPENAISAYETAIANRIPDDIDYKISGHHTDPSPTVLNVNVDGAGSYMWYEFGTTKYYAEMTIDWGDGSDVDKLIVTAGGGEDYYNLRCVNHVFNTAGTFEVKMYVTCGNIILDEANELYNVSLNSVVTGDYLVKYDTRDDYVFTRDAVLTIGTDIEEVSLGYASAYNKIIFENDVPPTVLESSFDSEWIGEHGPIDIYAPNESYLPVLTSAIQNSTDDYMIRIGPRRDPATSTPTIFKYVKYTGTVDIKMSIWLAAVSSYGAHVLIDWGDGTTAVETALTTTPTKITHTFDPKTRNYEIFEIKIYATFNNFKLYNNDSSIAITHNGYDNQTGFTEISTGDGFTVIGCSAFKSFTNPHSTYSYVILTKFVFGNDMALIDDSAFLSANFGYNACAIIFNNKQPLVIGDYAFKNASTMNLYLGDNISSIGTEAFYNTEIYSKNTLTPPQKDPNLFIPNTVTNIGSGAFSHTRVVPGVMIGNGVTTIPQDLFKDSTIEQIMIGENVSVINSNAFTSFYPNSSGELNFNSKTPPSFDSNWAIFDNNVDIYVPNTSYENVIAATNTDPTKYTIYVDRPLSEVTPSILHCEGDNAEFAMAGAYNQDQTQISVDWDDGTPIEEFMLISDNNNYDINVNPITHKYAEYGSYDIKIYTTIGNSTFKGLSTYKTQFSTTIKSVEIGDYTTDICRGTFSSDSVPNIIFGNNTVNLRYYSFYSAVMDNFEISRNVIVLSHAFDYANIKKLIINSSHKYIYYSYNYLISEIVIIGDSVTEIYNEAFKSSTIGAIRFTSINAPTLQSGWYSPRWYNSPPVVIIVPQDALEEYTTAIASSLPSNRYKIAISYNTPVSSTFTFTTMSENEEVFISLIADGFAEVVIDWGDGSENTDGSFSASGYKFTHTYSDAGIYTVTIYRTAGNAYIGLYNSDDSAYECAVSTNITSIVNADLIGISEKAFYNAINLTSIYLADSVETVGENAFTGCVALSSVGIADATTTTVTSGEFANCTSLTELKLPATLTSIEDNAFTNDNITKLTVYATTPPALTANSFADATVGTIYVPAESLDAYKASAWNDIATIKPIKYVDPDEYDPDSIEDVPGDPAPEQALSGDALKSIIKAYGKNLKFIKTENNTIAVNDPNAKGFNISSDDLIIRTFNGYDFVECKSYDPFFRKTYVSLIRVNDIRTFIIAENANDTIDGFRC